MTWLLSGEADKIERIKFVEHLMCRLGEKQRESQRQRERGIEIECAFNEQNFSNNLNCLLCHRGPRKWRHSGQNTWTFEATQSTTKESSNKVMGVVIKG